MKDEPHRKLIMILLLIVSILTILNECWRR